MSRALVRDSVPKRCHSNVPANGWLFPVPKNSEKASMIVHLVKFNRQHTKRPLSFSLPVVEDLALLNELHFLHGSQGAIAFSDGVGDYLCNPFLHTLHDLRMEAALGDPLPVCHVDLKNTFWSLRLLDDFKRLLELILTGLHSLSIASCLGGNTRPPSAKLSLGPFCND